MSIGRGEFTHRLRSSNSGPASVTPRVPPRSDGLVELRLEAGHAKLGVLAAAPGSVFLGQRRPGFVTATATPPATGSPDSSFVTVS